MLAVLMLTLLAGLVLPAQSLPQASGSTESEQAQRSSKKWLLADESKECLGNLDVYGDDFKIPDEGRCRRGYARHSNGRCYRVFDELPEDGELPKHSYQVTYEKYGCDNDPQLFPEYAEEMEAQGRLDVCDEDAGCFIYIEHLITPRKTCSEGFVHDYQSVCRRSLALIPNARRRSPKPAKKANMSN